MFGAFIVLTELIPIIISFSGPECIASVSITIELNGFIGTILYYVLRMESVHEIYAANANIDFDGFVAIVGNAIGAHRLPYYLHCVRVCTLQANNVLHFFHFAGWQRKRNICCRSRWQRYIEASAAACHSSGGNPRFHCYPQVEWPTNGKRRKKPSARRANKRGRDIEQYYTICCRKMPFYCCQQRMARNVRILLLLPLLFDFEYTANWLQMDAAHKVTSDYKSAWSNCGNFRFSCARWDGMD